MIKIAIFEKSNSNQPNAEKYILNKDTYSLLFFSNKLKLSYSIEQKNNWFVGFFKRLFSSNISKKDLIMESTFLILEFSDYNEESTIQYKNDKNIIYSNIYTNIDVSYYLNDEILECDFLLKDDCNPYDVNISLDESSVVTFDEDKNTVIAIGDFNFMMKKTTYNGKEFYFTLDGKNIKLKELVEESESEKIMLQNNDIIPEEISDDRIDSKESIMNVNVVDDISDTTLSMNAIPQDALIYSEEIRTLLISVDTSKFKYPYSKSSELLCSPNLPIIVSLLNSSEIKQEACKIDGICPGQEVTVYVDYKEISLIPYISYSVELLKVNDDYSGGTDPSDTPQMDFDVYAFKNDAFEGEAFEICKHIDDIPFVANDFLISLEIISSIDDTLSNLPLINPVRELDNYYLYEVQVKVTVYKAPPIIIPPEDTQTQEALNEALGRPSGSTEPFTPGELESITTINFSGDSTLDTSILRYTPNVTELDISNCDLDTSDTYYLQTLQYLEILNMSNNNVSSLESLKNDMNLNVLNVSGNDIADLLPLENLTELTTLNVSDNNITDLSPLENLTELTTLNVSGNNITNLSPLENLTELTALNASSIPSVTTFSVETLSGDSSNKIVDISPLANLVNLVYLNLGNNLIEDITPLSDLIKLENLDISENAIYDLTPINELPNLTELYAQGQVINLDPLYPIQDNDFVLDLSFLKDIDGITPCINYVSNGGYCTGEDSCDSCDCPGIMWVGILNDTNATIEFSHNIASSDISNFSGTINVLLAHEPQ